MSGPFSNPGRISLDSNGESAGDTCHHVSSRVAAGRDHDHSDPNSSVNLDLADQNGNPAIHHHPPHHHYQHQERDGHSDMTLTDEMRLREQIMARISPRAIMMSRTPPALPEVPVGDEPIAHQIRRVHSAYMAELRRQWEDQHQQRRQTQFQEPQQQSLHQYQRHNSYPLSQRSVSMSRFAPVATERTSPVMMQRSMPSSSATATGSQLQDDEEMHLRTLPRGSNSLYLNYEGGVLRTEEQWRGSDDDMVGR
ncbi:hypothetical protein BG015_005488 [Linnemannia schmuckeri]|uniref:Uncharacterized protein n=1 Tax=Linnemannia schmuckeri TaxID=64567 RepID=A0A9P5R5E3_9FUNG|nr:hypothetical protein BG015_005488 [Linnemannia schmuckeri]